MKKLILLSNLLLALFTVKAQSVDSILLNYEKAAGGRPALQAIKTLQFATVVNVDFMNQKMEIGIEHYKEDSKLYRRDVQGMMGIKGSFSMITDTAGYVSTPAVQGYGEYQGREASITKMDTTQLQALQYELDCNGPFGFLVNYAAKGHKIELAGKAKANKVDCYKLKVTLKSGQQMVYYISSVDYNVVQSEAIGKVALEQLGLESLMRMMGSDRANSLKVTTIYTNYKDFGGVKFPTKETFQVGSADLNMSTSSIVVNEPIDAAKYKAK